MGIPFLGTLLTGGVAASILLGEGTRDEKIESLGGLLFSVLGASGLAALGVSVGTEDDSKALNLEKLRYHKIVIMCDADVDGSHISTLILTFFFRYMRELIENGHVYIATPPLYLLKKGAKKQYAWNDPDRDKLVEDFGNGASVQRYKGLGEMNAIQLWDTTMNPESRTFRKVTIENAGEADRVFSMLMGDEVPPRREFIERNATYANIDV